MNTPLPILPILAFFNSRRMNLHHATILTECYNADIKPPENPIYITTLIKHCHVTTSAMTQLLDSMEKENLITRKSYPGDRRKHQVTITEYSKALINTFLCDDNPDSN